MRKDCYNIRLSISYDEWAAEVIHNKKHFVTMSRSPRKALEKLLVEIEQHQAKEAIK